MTTSTESPLRAYFAIEALKTILSTEGQPFEARDDQKAYLQSASLKAVKVADALMEALMSTEQDNLLDRWSATSPRVKDTTMEVLGSIECLYEKRGEPTGISTGFPDMDRITDGFHSGEMIVIASRPAIGKTSFALNIIEHSVLNLKIPVAIFSLEMSAHQIVQRLLCSRAKISLQTIRDGFMRDSDFNKLTVAASELAESKIIIDDAANLNILELQKRCRQLKSKHNIQMIVVDYLQLLWSPSRRGQENRQLEISDISRGIKALAKELGIPIIAISQLNRNPELRAGGKPRLSDLRESGSIEQDADLVCLLTRPEFYDEDDEFNDTPGEAELIIAKQRNGPIGEIPLTFISKFTRFESRGEIR